MRIRDVRGSIGKPMRPSTARTYGKFGGLIPLQVKERDERRERIIARANEKLRADQEDLQRREEEEEDHIHNEVDGATQDVCPSAAKKSSRRGRKGHCSDSTKTAPKTLKKEEKSLNGSNVSNKDQNVSSPTSAEPLEATQDRLSSLADISELKDDADVHRSVYPDRTELSRERGKAQYESGLRLGSITELNRPTAMDPGPSVVHQRISSANRVSNAEEDERDDGLEAYVNGGNEESPNRLLKSMWDKSTIYNHPEEPDFLYPNSKYEELVKDYVRGLAEREMLTRRFFDPMNEKSEFLSRVLQSLEEPSFLQESSLLTGMQNSIEGRCHSEQHASDSPDKMGRASFAEMGGASFLSNTENSQLRTLALTKEKVDKVIPRESRKPHSIWNDLNQQSLVLSPLNQHNASGEIPNTYNKQYFLFPQTMIDTT